MKPLTHEDRVARDADGRSLRGWRMLTGRTQAALAVEVGVAHVMVCRWETGEQRIAPARRVRLIELGWSPPEPLSLADVAREAATPEQGSARG